MKALTKKPFRSADPSGPSDGGPSDCGAAGRVARFATVFFATCALALGDEALTELIQQLPSNCSRPPDQILIGRIADRGEAAIPALEKELHLGISFRNLNRMLQANQSRRSAVVQILAKIPGPQSTDLLVRSLADTPDCFGMRVATLEALSKRSLSDVQVETMIGNSSPDVVIAGLAHATNAVMSPKVKAAVERIFEPKTAMPQFVNEYGAKTITDEGFWAVRLAAGKALQKDMVADMRQRAQRLLGEMKSEALHPSKPDEAEWLHDFSRAELAVLRALDGLAALGEPVKDLVSSEADSASGAYSQYLDMALARLGSLSRETKIADHLTGSTNITVRVCAVVTLRRLRKTTLRPALEKALRDPYHRTSGSDVGPPRVVYPVRTVAADALIDLGENPQQVRSKAKEP
jgi:hypothetical protein